MGLLLSWCRREDSNLHPVNPDQTLNLARLPIPPLRHRTQLCVQIYEPPTQKSSNSHAEECPNVKSYVRVGGYLYSKFGHDPLGNDVDKPRKRVLHCGATG